MKHTFAITLAFALSVGNAARAAEIEEFYTGVRQLGMGGAYAAVVNDETAILTNPAGLAKVRDTTVTVIDPELTGSFSNTQVTGVEKFPQMLELQNLLEALKEKKGVHWNAKLQLFPSVITTNVGAGLHAKYSYNAEVDEAGNIFRLDYTNDYAAALASTLRLYGGIVKIGFAGRAIDRTEIHKDISTSSTDLTVSNQASEGLGVAADLGIILTAPVQYLPSLAIVGRDLGNTSYTLSDGLFHATQTRPITTKQTVDVGIAMFPIAANNARFTFTADYHDVLKAYEKDSGLMKRVHVGAEMNLNDYFFLRGGLNQKYWTAGLEVASAQLQFQFASYGEDIGAGSTSREDRRWVTKVVFRF